MSEKLFYEVDFEITDPPWPIS